MDSLSRGPGLIHVRCVGESIKEEEFNNIAGNDMIKYLISFLLVLMIIGCEISEQAKVDRLFENYTGDVPGAAVMIIKDGKAIFSKTYGLANLEKKTEVQTRTNFRLASVTKQFTAMCIMKLVENGKLNYSSSLTDLIPGFPSFAV